MRAKENAGKGNAAVIRRRIREEYADDLPGKKAADQRQYGAEGKGKYQREFEGDSVTLPVFRTDRVAEPLFFTCDILRMNATVKQLCRQHPAFYFSSTSSIL